MDMENKNPKKMISRTKAVVACILCLLLGGVAAFGGVWAALGSDGITLLQANRLITEKFVGDYDETAHREATMEAMVDSLGDRWSYYLTPQEYQQVQDTRSNSYVGIGVTVSRDEPDGLLILSVTQGGPAQEAGLTAGEIIRAVDGTPVTEETREDCVTAIKGAEGTTVRLEVEGTDGLCRTVEVERRTVRGITAAWEMVAGNVGHITIQNFYSGTADLVRQGVEELTAQGAKALVLDVRNNPGGYVTELTEILDLLLPEGDIFISRSYDGKEKVYTSDGACVDLPLAVLVNGDSYSAAEFLAAQLRESAGAVVAGTRTCGKGYSQMLYRLYDGSAIGLSTARYYTGGGESLIGVGLEPDPAVELTEEAKARLLVGELPYEEDLQLQAAIKALDLGE
ncbi:S41 family peptidase [Evtepia sp.]|uniref:S41 family peptidase n=1 Tax=Evtepia sp. TaxID=2773933 RepID=UPI003F18BA98